MVSRDGVVFYRHTLAGRVRHAIVTPPSMRRVVMVAAHSAKDAGHGGVDRAVTRVMQNHWWPGLTADVQRFVANCETCQRAKSQPPPKAPLQSLPVPAGPNERVHVDLFGPLRTSTAGNKYILVMTDAFSKYAEMASILDKSATSVARAFLERWICYLKWKSWSHGAEETWWWDMVTIIPAARLQYILMQYGCGE